jgi:hypothetical protein
MLTSATPVPHPTTWLPAKRILYIYIKRDKIIKKKKGKINKHIDFESMFDGEGGGGGPVYLIQL